MGLEWNSSCCATGCTMLGTAQKLWRRLPREPAPLQREERAEDGTRGMLSTAGPWGCSKRSKRASLCRRCPKGNVMANGTRSCR